MPMFEFQYTEYRLAKSYEEAALAESGTAIIAMCSRSARSICSSIVDDITPGLKHVETQTVAACCVEYGL